MGTYIWKCSTMNKQQPFRLGTGGDCGFRGGDRGVGTYTWRCSTMNKQQPFRLGTGGDWGFRGGDRGVGTYTWRCSNHSGHKRSESAGTSDAVTPPKRPHLPCNLAVHPRLCPGFKILAAETELGNITFFDQTSKPASDSVSCILLLQTSIQ